MSNIQTVDVFVRSVPIFKGFTFASGSAGKAGDTAHLIYVCITADDGSTGWGECRPVHQWSSETVQTVVSTIEIYLAPCLIGMPIWDRVGITSAMGRVIQTGPATGQPIAKAAIDMALHDLLAIVSGVPLREFLGGDRTRNCIDLSYTITGHEIGEVAEDMSYALEQGFKHFNFKAAISRQTDIRVAETISDRLPDGGFLWADANQGYSLPDAKYVTQGFAEVGVNVLEQPLPSDNFSAMRQLRQATNLPLAVDESSVSPANFFEFVQSDLVDYLVIKVTRSGGIWPSLQQIAVAQAAGLDLLVSGLADGLMTKIAVCQLASVFDFTGPAALNGSQFIDDSALFPTKSTFEQAGTVTLNNQPGLGVTPVLR